MWVKAHFEVIVYQYPDDRYLVTASGWAKPVWPWRGRWLGLDKYMPIKTRLGGIWVRGQVAAREEAFGLASALGVDPNEVKWENG